MKKIKKELLRRLHPKALKLSSEEREFERNRNSRLFTQTVLDAFRGGIIEPTQASNLLNVQVNKFPKLEAQLYK